MVSLMGEVVIDNLVVLFALVYYVVLIFVYLLRAHESELEWKISPVFSTLLIPFASLWMMKLLFNNSGRLITGLPIIIYPVYDLWYRAITKKNPIITQPDLLTLLLRRRLNSYER
jgi:hypothetical protein